MPKKLKVQVSIDSRTLRITVPTKWKSGPVEKLLQFVLSQRDEKLTSQESFHFVNSKNNTPIPNQAPITSWIVRGDLLVVTSGPGPVIKSNAKSLNDSYKKWNEIEKKIELDDEDESSTKLTPSQVEKECTNQILKWTNETERLRKFLTHQYNSKVDTLPFPTLVQNVCRHATTHSLTHLLTHSPTHSLTHPLTHSLTHSLTNTHTYTYRYGMRWRIKINDPHI